MVMARETWSRRRRIGLELVAGVGHRAKSCGVRHRVARRGVDAAYALLDNAAQGGFACLEVGPLLACAPQQCGGVPPTGTVDDEVPLEGCGVDLQRSERSGDVAAAACLLGELLEPSRQPRLLECGLLLRRLPPAPGRSGRGYVPSARGAAGSGR